nr:ATP-binding protein [Domibacillus antri]
MAGEEQKHHRCHVNIIKNGVESMPHGRTITIQSTENNGKTFIKITDSGVEMTGEPHHERPQNGLGTMAVHSIVKFMRGEMKVESAIGKGTSFTLFIPAVENDHSAKNENGPP